MSSGDIRLSAAEAAEFVTHHSQIKESLIRKMTRLAEQHNAVNLSQGFPNEGPPKEGIERIVCALLGGDSEESADRIANMSLENEKKTFGELVRRIVEANSAQQDSASQYSMPFGRRQLRENIALYYQRWYPEVGEDLLRQKIDPDDNITVTLGATEALAAVVRTICVPHDKVLMMEPYHELYPSQCKVFYLDPVFTTLRENAEARRWELDFYVVPEMKHVMCG